jgi:hypothetical protein
MVLGLEEVIMKHRTYFQSSLILKKSDYHNLFQNVSNKLSTDIQQHSIRSKTSSSLGKSLKFCTVYHTCDILVVVV